MLGVRDPAEWIGMSGRYGTWVSMTFHIWVFRAISQLDLDGSRAWMKVCNEVWMIVMQMSMRVMPRLKLAIISS